MKKFHDINYLTTLTTVELGYNDHEYNEFTAINKTKFAKILGPKCLI